VLFGTGTEASEENIASIFGGTESFNFSLAEM